MINGIINGYYRTGTTIIFWILQQSNPEIPIIYEPNSPSVVQIIKKYKKDSKNKKMVIHENIPIFKPYSMLDDGTFNKLCNSINPLPVIVNYEDFIKSVEPLIRYNGNIYIKSNQLLCINDVLIKLKCNAVHIIRDPAEVLYSHLITPYKTIEEVYKYNIFFIRDIVNEFYKIGLVTDKNDLIKAFLDTYINYNYFIYSNRDKRLKIYRFEDIVYDTDKYMSKISKHLGIKYNKELSILIDKNKAFQCNKEFKSLVNSKYTRYLKDKVRCMGYEI